MRIGELSRLSGVSIPTIKYYIREGLVEPGVRTDFNQTQYEETHVGRLRLIKTLTGYGRLSLAEVGELFSRVFQSDPKDAPLEALSVPRTCDSKREPTAEDREWADSIVERYTTEDKYMQRLRGPGKVLRRSLEQFPEEYRAQVEQFLDEYLKVADQMVDIDRRLAQTLINDDNTMERHVFLSVATVMLRSEILETFVSMGHERHIMDLFFTDEDFAEMESRYQEDADADEVTN